MTQTLGYKIFPNKQQWDLLKRQAIEDGAVYMWAFNKLRDQMIKTHKFKDTCDMIDEYCEDKKEKKPYIKGVNRDLLGYAIDRAKDDVLVYVNQKKKIPSASPKHELYFTINAYLYISHDHKILIPRLTYYSDHLKREINWITLDYNCNLKSGTIVDYAIVKLLPEGFGKTQWYLILTYDPDNIQRQTKPKS